jgi:ABC-2 type transport system ATP-binding protein
MESAPHLITTICVVYVEMLEVVSVSKRYHWGGPLAVDRVSLKVEPGELVGLVGLNGAGKTTTLRVACGVSLPQGGTTRIDGLDIATQKRRASRLVGWVPEYPTHDGRSRIADLLHYYSDLSGGVSRERPLHLLEEWGIQGKARSRFRELSLGQQKRVAIVVASLLSPRYFLLDEPFNGLDPVAFEQFRTWMERVRGEGIGLLLSSHNLREVQAICDRVVVIHHGRVISELTGTELDERQSGPVNVVLDRMDAAAVAILERFGRVEVKGKRARVTGAGLDAGAISSALASHGYAVRQIAQEQPELERVFLDLVGDDS